MPVHLVDRDRRGDRRGRRPAALGPREHSLIADTGSIAAAGVARPSEVADAGGANGTRWFDWPLPRATYARPTTDVAKRLLGAILVRAEPPPPRAARIVETEAYVARDSASHAFRGVTARNRSMFGTPGTLYVYRIHQVHCMNVVTNRGEAVLLRSAEPLTEGLSEPRGPGRLARAFGITRRDDGLDLTQGALRLAAGPPPPERIVAAPRVGIRRATERKLRFALKGNAWVSSPRPWGGGTPRRRRSSGSSPS